MAIDRDPVELTVAEAIAGLLVLLPAAVILSAYVVDTIGWSIDPALMLILLVLEVIATALWIWRCQTNLNVRFDGWELFGFTVIVVGLSAYVLWLARPSFLPVTQSGDIVHHISLIDFILHFQSLVHDPSLGSYLVEMTVYPPGGHILAALVTAWLGTSVLRVLHPLLAVLVAIKAGIVYNLILRLVPPSRRNPAIAVAGTALLFLPYGYFLYSFTAWYFYAMVIAETFAMAMLWVLVSWHVQPSRGLLAFFTLCGTAMLLTWPGWLPILLVALISLLFIRRDFPFTNRAQWFAWVASPIFVIGVVYMLGGVGPTGGLVMHEGSVMRPSVQIFDWPLLILAMFGIAISIRSRRAMPVLLFSSALASQTIILWLFAKNHMASYYIMYKMFHLFLYPMVLFAAITLDATWHSCARSWPTVWKLRWRRLATVLPVLVLTLTLRRELPSHLYSPVNESLYEVGLWAKGHLPNGCVDYLVDNWVTAYWLHVNVLRNPRVSQRTETIVNVADFYALQDSPARWDNPGGLPFAIISDLRAVPPDVRSRLEVLYESPPSAIVQRSDKSTCHNDHRPFSQG